MPDFVYEDFEESSAGGGRRGDVSSSLGLRLRSKTLQLRQSSAMCQRSARRVEEIGDLVQERTSRGQRAAEDEM